METQHLGAWGEESAARYLTARGLRVVDRHYRQKWGELDLVCFDGKVCVFVEVKARTRQRQPSALDAITPRKRERLIRAALSYLKWKHLEDCEVRFDVVLIEAGEITWIQNAFESSGYYTV